MTLETYALYVTPCIVLGIGVAALTIQRGMIWRRSASRRPLSTKADRIAKAVADFEAALPGWWWSAGACSVSCDASCGPDRAGPDADLLSLREFDEGFHHDGNGDVADSLAIVMHHALQRREQVRSAPTPHPEAAATAMVEEGR